MTHQIPRWQSTEITELIAIMSIYQFNLFRIQNGTTRNVTRTPDTFPTLLKMGCGGRPDNAAVDQRMVAN